jgi:hypothetical protein
VVHHKMTDDGDRIEQKTCKIKLESRTVSPGSKVASVEVS